MINFRKASFLSLLFFFNLCFSQEKEKFQVALVGFYNLENLYDTINQDYVDDQEFTPEGTRRYTGQIYWDKLSKLDRVLSDLGTDHSIDGPAILGVAEIENRSVLRDLCRQEGLKSRNYQIVHYDSKDARGVDVGLLYNPKYFKVLKSEKIFVDLSEFGDGKTRDILYVKGLFLGEELHVMVGHWPSRRGGEEASMARRCKAAQVMRQKSDSVFMENPNANIIAMGDLNDDPVSPSLTDCLKARGTKEEAKDGVFFNPFMDYFNKGIGTLAYNDAWNLFDQIVISPGLVDPNSNLRYSGGFIFSRKYMVSQDGPYRGYPFRTYSGDIYSGGYSDHFPTYLVFKKKLASAP